MKTRIDALQARFTARNSLLFLPVAMALLVMSSVQARTWTSANGKQTFEGELHNYNRWTGVVSVTMPNGKVNAFRQELLSKEDIAFLKKDLEPASGGPTAVPSARLSLPDVLPDPDGKAADMSKPVKVFILMGQSNMLGFGRVGPEETKGTLSQITKQEGKFPNLVDGDGNWTVRKDVRNIHVMSGKDMKNGWLTVEGAHIGPELEFGYIMGHVLEEPVLVLKACIGNRSLGWDLLPPGSERFEFGGRIYAGYKDSPDSWAKGEQPQPIGWYAGKQYDSDMAYARRVLNDLPQYYPGSKDRYYEVAGFVWWQGHKDQNAAHASRYEQNLVHLIKTLRQEFNAPKAPFVLATIAFGGKGLGGDGLTVAKAQLAVDGDKGKYPEFKGNVKTIDARPFWRESSVSPSGAGYHYNHNAETYCLVGDALGRAMAEMLNR